MLGGEGCEAGQRGHGTVAQAREAAYDAIRCVHLEGSHYRTDIACL
jgi:phosphoribosylamine-glycine ligase